MLFPSAARIGIDAVCNAHASIIVFFVLSGYVLTGSLRRRRGLSLPSVRRFLSWPIVPAISCTLGGKRNLSFVSLPAPTC